MAYGKGECRQGRRHSPRRWGKKEYGPRGEDGAKERIWVGEKRFPMEKMCLQGDGVGEKRLLREKVGLGGERHSLGSICVLGEMGLGKKGSLGKS
jgi:hypothetical protein